MSAAREKVATGGTNSRSTGSVRSDSGRSVRFLVLWSTAMLLGLLGMVMVLSSSSVSDLRDYDDAWYHLRRQVVWVALGLAGLFTTLRFD